MGQSTSLRPGPHNTCGSWLLGTARQFSHGMPYAMQMRPNKAETAVHGCHCPGDMAIRMRKVLARPWVGVRVCHLLLLLLIKMKFVSFFSPCAFLPCLLFCPVFTFPTKKSDESVIYRLCFQFRSLMYRSCRDVFDVG